MSTREYDESDARVRPARSTRRRTKDRPAHTDAIFSLVTAVDRGRTLGFCLTSAPQQTDGLGRRLGRARLTGVRARVRVSCTGTH